MALNIENEKLLQEAFSNLPKSVRNWIASLQIIQIIHDINENANIFTNARRSVIPDIVFRLAIKDINPSAVIATLASELQIKPEDAMLLAEEIAERIFAPIKQTLAELGVDIEKMKQGVSVKEEIPPVPISRIMPIVPSAPSARNVSMKMNELTSKYDATKPENDKLAASKVETMLVDLRKKKMETPPDVGREKFVPRDKITTLPPPEVKIDARFLSTLREEGDKIKLREELPTSKGEVMPFMLHKEDELPPIQSTKSFHSDIEAGYPRSSPLPHIPVQIEIGSSESTAKPVRETTNLPASFAKSLGQTPVSAPPPIQVISQNVPKIDRAARANETLRRPSLSAEFKKAQPPAPPVYSPPSIPKADPKIEGNMLDLRSSQ
ncbi:MAG TPA: hypothetical protein VJK04_03670 [Candidatus Paceibacterota bacterium]